MQVTIKNVDVENVRNGRKQYSKATVDYLFKGESRQQKIMSFANPEVFKLVQEMVGQEVEVELTKNDAGYSEWKSITPAGQAPSNASGGAAAPATRVSGSNYETKDERAARQVLIVKQSSLGTAVEALGPGKAPDEYLDLAGVFTDWVFEQPEQE